MQSAKTDCLWPHHFPTPLTVILQDNLNEDAAQQAETKTRMESAGGKARELAAGERWAREWGKDTLLNYSFAPHSFAHPFGLQELNASALLSSHFDVELFPQ
jgi:hypothetical protein